MNAEQIVEKIQDKRGASLNVRLVSEIEALKSHAGKLVQKITEMTVISGVSFENRKDVREAIEAGERSEVGSLKWGEWKQFPFVISHKGAEYIRLYLPSQAQQEAGFCRKPSVKFFCDGVEISREQAEEICGSKAKARENAEGCMTVKASNLEII